MTFNAFDLNDPFAVAAQPVTDTPRDIFGQVSMDAYFAVLKKGSGKVPFDAGQHELKDRRTVIQIAITPLAESPLQWTVERESISEFPKDAWQAVTRPSLEALGIANPREVDGKWCRARLVPTGREYTGSDGSLKKATGIEFLAFYADEAECVAAYNADAGEAPAASNGHAAPSANGHSASAAHAGPEYEMAKAFLPAIVKTAVAGNGIDLPKLTAALKDNAILAKYFTPASPEVQAAIQAALAEPAF